MEIQQKSTDANWITYCRHRTYITYGISLNDEDDDDDGELW